MVMCCGLCVPRVSRCRGPTIWDTSSRQQHKHHTLLLSFTHCSIWVTTTFNNDECSAVGRKQFVCLKSSRIKSDC